MRLRNVKGAREKIENSKYVVHNKEELKGKWSEFFKNDNPIHVEIGMGKGKFIQQLAFLNSNINYIGIEKFSSVLVRAIERQEETDLPNLYFLRMDAEEIVNVFDCNEVDQIYLNFSDPWPKERHTKRRLTSKEFFARYDKILKPEGKVYFKTDNRELFDFSVEEIPQANWKLSRVTYDLHHSEFLEGNVMTEYEEKFVKENKPINQLIAYR